MQVVFHMLKAVGELFILKITRPLPIIFKQMTYLCKHTHGLVTCLCLLTSMWCWPVPAVSTA